MQQTYTCVSLVSFYSCQELIIPVLEIRDILVRIPGSVDPYLWLMDSDPAPFFSDFKAAKKIIFSLHITDRRHIIFSLKNSIF